MESTEGQGDLGMIRVFPADTHLKIFDWRFSGPWMLSRNDDDLRGEDVAAVPDPDGTLSKTYKEPLH